MAMWVIAIGALTGCILQPEPVIARGPPHGAPDVTEEHRESSELQALPEQVGNGLDITLAHPNECRDRKPMQQEIETHRHAYFYEQALNALGFAALGGYGVYALTASCTTTPAASAANPSPTAQPCTTDQKSQTQLVGGSLIGIGALFGAAFVYNVLRARDTTETIEIPSEWHACPAPVGNTAVRLVLGGQQLDGTTDASGHVHFGPIYWLPENLESGKGELVLRDTNAHVALSLTSLPAYTRWKQREDTARAYARAAEAQRRSTGIAGNGVQLCTSLGIAPEQCTPCVGRCFEKFRGGDMRPDELEACTNACSTPSGDGTPVVSDGARTEPSQPSRQQCLSRCYDQQKTCYNNCVLHNPPDQVGCGNYEPCVDAFKACSAGCGR